MLNQTLMNINKSQEKKWTEHQKFDEEYVFIEKSMVGCYIAVFIKRKLTSRIKQKSFQICKVKTGNYGTTGNKGAVCVRFQVDNQTIMAINCHLVSGRRREGQRNEMIAKIFESAFENNLRNRGLTVENHDQVLLMGDLNFRINAFSRDEVIDKIKKNKREELLNEDDLIVSFEKFNQMTRKQQMENRYQDMFFTNFQEGKINFNPTYKFDIRTDNYDSSKKNRVPAFCDRILWKRNHNLTQLYYNSIPEVNFTDHKPVVAHFQLHSSRRKQNRRLNSAKVTPTQNPEKQEESKQNLQEKQNNVLI